MREPKRTRRKMKAHMEDVMVVPMELWLKLGNEQRSKDNQITELTDRVDRFVDLTGNLEKELEKEKTKRLNLEREVEDFKGDLEWERKRFKELDHRFEGLIESRQNLAEAAASSGYALREVMLLLEVSGVRLKKAKKDKDRRR